MCELIFLSVILFRRNYHKNPNYENPCDQYSILYSFLQTNQQRDAEIRSAWDAYNRGGIDVDCLLKRVTYNKNKICENLLTFDNLSVLHFVDEYEYDYEAMNLLVTEPWEQNGNKNFQNDESDDSLCQTCYVQPRNCMLAPCGHIYFCMSCYAKWNSVDKSAFDLIMFEGDDGDIRNNTTQDNGVEAIRIIDDDNDDLTQGQRNEPILIDDQSDYPTPAQRYNEPLQELKCPYCNDPVTKGYQVRQT